MRMSEVVFSCNVFNFSRTL